MTDSAAATSQALLGTWTWFGDHLSQGWSEATSSAVAAVSGVPAPPLNGVWIAPSEGDATDVLEPTRLLDRVAATGLPHCLQFPTGHAALAELAADRGLVRADDIPLMRLDRPLNEPHGGVATLGSPLAVRRLDPVEAPLHGHVAAVGFGAPEDLFAAMVGPEVTGRPEIALYLGEVGGEPVVTGLGVRGNDWVGMFNIATPPDHRRRGFATALTARMLSDAFAEGASWAWLQSSAAGRGVYRRLGFVDVAVWECWITP